MDAQNKELSPAQMKMKELERKRQIAAEVTPSLKDIATIKRRINNLKKKMLIKDIDKQMMQELNKADQLPEKTEGELQELKIQPFLLLDETLGFYERLEAKIQLRLENL